MIRISRSELVERSSDIVLLDLEATVDLAHGRAVPKLPSEMRSSVFCVLSDTVARISEKSCTELTPEARERYAETLSFLGRAPALPEGQQLVVLLRDEAVVRSSIRLTTQARDLVSKYELYVHQLVMIGAIRELDDVVRDDGARVRTHVVAKSDSLAQLVVDLYNESLYVRVSAQAPRVQGGYRPGPFDALAALGTAPVSRMARTGGGRVRGPLFDTHVMLHPDVHDSPGVRDAMEGHSDVLLPHRVALELLSHSLPAAARRGIPRGEARRGLRDIHRGRFQGRELHIAEDESAHDCRRQLELHARSATEDFSCPGLTDEQLIILGERLNAEVFTMDGAARTWSKEYFPSVQLRP
ncbi:hypothetical protein [Nocardioides sp. Soil805]|uniref:hypothetical protein n=1 Tax=Nocardioides sp. Soil805 TaxID=1736416 RepID=UPI0007026106|nr:hypothetical protein [Nocardioides sp. Soil805]KRF37412.1 hypothetical protein ASG94_08805 [Nocardioides sp. Soil805]